MRLAVDTNVLGRAIVDDGSEQASRSRQCFVDHEVYIADTVLLETEWLLRSRLKLPRDTVNMLLARLVSSPRVLFDDRIKIGTAILAHARGLDFADAMHLLAAEGCEAMATFDEDFIKRQKMAESSVPVRHP
jgi:predicted nucleic-acid-binding protein